MMYRSLDTIILPSRMSHVDKAKRVETELIDVTIPALLGLDLMDQKYCTACIVIHKLVMCVLKNGTLVNLPSVDLARAESTNSFGVVEMPERIHLTHSTAKVALPVFPPERRNIIQFN